MGENKDPVIAVSKAGGRVRFVTASNTPSVSSEYTKEF